MRHLRPLFSVLTLLALLAAFALPASAQAATTFVIGVDHLDLANQQPDKGRIFEYADFFPRGNINIHTGDTLDFQQAPGSVHLLAVGPDEKSVRSTYFVVKLDSEDAVKAIGSGQSKLELGPGNFSVTGGSTTGGGVIASNPNGPPVCGVPQIKEPVCTFKGGTDIEVAGLTPAFDLTAPPSATAPPAPAVIDWKIQINAPVGSYAFLCIIHPNMKGSFNVVAASAAASTQAQLDAAGAAQFGPSQASAVAAEKAADGVKFTGGDPGTRTYQFTLGTGSADGHVNILEMFPTQPPTLAAGDKLTFQIGDPNEVHTASFPANDKRLPEPFGFDCGATFQSPPSGPPAPGAAPFVPCLETGAHIPELVGDPGNTASGSALTDPTALVDSGILGGSGYGLGPNMSWSLVTNAATKAGTYKYQCTVHDFMQGAFIVAAAAPAPTVTTPAALPRTGAGGGSIFTWASIVLVGLLLVGFGGWRLAARER